MQTVSECSCACWWGRANEALAYVLGALDPCAPLGVFECAWCALSARAQDGACLVLIAGYSLAWALGACRRSLRGAEAPCGASAEQFWPGGDGGHTYYVKIARKATRI